MAFRAHGAPVARHGRVIVTEWGPAKCCAASRIPTGFRRSGWHPRFDRLALFRVTTTACGALKEAVKGREADLGAFVAGGKGAVSRRTPWRSPARSGTSRRAGGKSFPTPAMSAKVDSTAVQDGYQIYHHCFFFTREGDWAVVQQGMNTDLKWARRYHWLGK